MSKKIEVYFYCAAILLLAVGCSSASKTAEEVQKPSTYPQMKGYSDVSYLYNPSRKYIHPSVQVFHNGPNLSTLSVQIFTHELLYTKLSRESALVADVRIKWGIRAIKNSRSLELEVIDTNKVDFSIIKNDNMQVLFKDYQIALDTGKNYALIMEIKDLKRGHTVKVHEHILKKNLMNHHAFQIYDAGTNQLKRAPYITNNQKLHVSHIKNPDYFVVDYYKDLEDPANPLLAPANSVSSGSPDSSWVVYNAQGKSYFTPHKPGYYHVRADSNAKGGVGVLNLYEAYPDIQEPEHMIEPLIYFTNVKALEKIRAQKKQKLAVDNFWLKATGEQVDKARTAIRVFYNRVYLSNYFFTSFKPGWQTDRGMIYTLYGQPNVIKKSHAGELWAYYGKSASKDVRFYFDHKPIPLNANRYILRRGSVENSRWREVISSWQSGQIFSLLQ